MRDNGTAAKIVRAWGPIILFSGLIMAWSSIPNWAGKALEDGQLSYAGTFFDETDYAVHLAMMRSGMQGNWAYGLRFTTEPHSAKYFRLFYIALGQLNRVLHMDPEQLYHLARWIFGMAASLSLFKLAARFLKSPASQWTAFFLIVFGSGLGFVERIFSIGPSPITPVDLWLIDAYVFFSLAIFPHFAFTLSMMALSMLAYVVFLDTRRRRNIGVVMLAAWLVQAVNPIAFLVVDIFIAALTLLSWWQDKKIHWEQAGALLAVALAQLPLLTYNYLPFIYDPIWSQFTSQNETLSPSPVYYLLGFGFLWVLAAFGTVRAFREKNRVMLAFLAWLVGAFLLAYMPVGIQRRFLLGVTIPLGMLSAYALQAMVARLAKIGGWLGRRAPAVVMLIVLLCSMTSILIPPAYSIFLRSKPKTNFYPRSMDAAFDWIQQNAKPDDFFLGSEDSSRLISQKTGRRVYLGHSMETLHYQEKLGIARSYYEGRLPVGWLQGQPVQWIIYGPYEQRIAPGFAPGTSLELAWEGDGIKIYRVK